MTTTMSMSTRHQRIDELVRQDQLVRERANEFNNAQRENTKWHLSNNPTAHATLRQLDELNELLTYSEFCLENLKCAKRRAYKQVEARYPRIWDTNCPDPFATDTQAEKEPGGETEEMEEAPHADPLIRAGKLMGILDREEAAYKVSIGFCDLWDLDASDLHARLATVQTIRTQLERLIDEAKETTNA